MAATGVVLELIAGAAITWVDVVAAALSAGISMAGGGGGGANGAGGADRSGEGSANAIISGAACTRTCWAGGRFDVIFELF